MKLKEGLIYLITVAGNFLLSFLINLIIFKTNMENFIFVACSIIVLVTLVVYIIAQKNNYKLDIFAYNIEDQKYLILNSIFIGCLFCVPLAMFSTLML